MPVVPEPTEPILPTDGLVWSGLSPETLVTVPFRAWWLVVPERPALSIPLKRVTSSSGSTNIGTPSYTEDRPVATGIYQAFEREKPIVMHGQRQSARFDINATFFGEDEWAGFELLWNETLDDGLGVLVQSDQQAQWWADLGATRPASVLSATDRQTNPVRVVTLACVEVDPPE